MRFALSGDGYSTLVWLRLDGVRIFVNLKEAALAMGYEKEASTGAPRMMLLTSEKARRCQPHRAALFLDYVHSKVLQMTRCNVEAAEAIRELFAVRLGNPESFKFKDEYEKAEKKLCEIAAQVRASQATAKPVELATVFDSPSSESSSRFDVSQLLSDTRATLVDRSEEVAVLHNSWKLACQTDESHPHILTFVAPGGEGKTSVVTKWLAEMAGQTWPQCERAFAWSFYKQGSRTNSGDSDLFLRTALEFFGEPDAATAASDPEEKGRKLAHTVGKQQAILILDGLETLQFPITSIHRGHLSDLGVTGLLAGLAASSKGVCVVTTRSSVPELSTYRHTTAPEVALAGLSEEHGAELLARIGVEGSPGELKDLVSKVNGHALTLHILGTYLRDAHRGDVRKHTLVELERADEEQGGHAFRVMASYARWLSTDGERGKRALAVLRMLGLFDRPASLDCLRCLQQRPAIPDFSEPLVNCTTEQLNITITRLEDAKLITTCRDHAGALNTIDTHPLIREFFAKDFQRSCPTSWEGAHDRLFSHLQRKAEDHPQTIEGLQPLYQAITHGCLAGKQVEALRDVYRGRILRGDTYFSTYQLGAYASDLGAVACFFDEPWSVVSAALPSEDQAWLLNQAAFCLRPLGRLTEARGCMRSASELRTASGDWIPAAVSAGQMSEIELALGEHASAVRSSQLAVEYADNSRDTYARMTRRATHADALHNAGNFEDADKLFREAEALEQSRPTSCPALRSLSRFGRSDLHLHPIERAVWRVILDIPLDRPGFEIVFEQVRNQVAQTLPPAVEAGWLVNIGVDHLTLARATLYEAVLLNKSVEPCVEFVERAVQSLRKAHVQDYLVRGLFTRALLRCQLGTQDGIEAAIADLDEAWHLTQRGPMISLSADVLLHRSRLFRDHSPYPWSATANGTAQGYHEDLAAVRRIIETTGYGRRREELGDAEIAILGQPHAETLSGDSLT